MSRANLLFTATLVFGIVLNSFEVFSFSRNLEDPFATEYIVAPQDTIPLEDRQGDFITNPSNNPFDLKDPSIIQQDVEYDPVTGQYIITEKIDDNYFRAPTYMTFEEYLDYRAKQQEEQYFKELSGITSGRTASGRLDPIAKVDVKSELIDRLFGGTEVDIRPQGEIDLTFGWEYTNTQNPSYTQRQQRQGGFDFDMSIRMNVEGSIGEKLKLSTNYNTQATFDFDNTMKLDYSTDEFSEDDIIKKIEAGNVSLPLHGTLIQGSQSLFGLKTELQFGRLRVTAVASQQKSEREQITLQNGSQFQEFEVRADEYDENRHFFLTHFNRNEFEGALSNLPQIKTLFRIENIEVWITDTRNATENIRDIVAIADLGEPERFTNQNPAFQSIPGYPHRSINQRPLPDNNANGIFEELEDNPSAKFSDKAITVLKTPPLSLQQVRDFEKVSARKLAPSEFSIHPELGFISLNINVRPDEVLGVAFEYSYGDSIFQVGQLSNDIRSTQDTITKNVLFVKMLKSSTQNVGLPTWDLMMKNIYNIGAYQASNEDFKLDIFYEDPGRGLKRFMPEGNIAGVPLLRIFNLDKLNSENDPQPDGVFDFVKGLTIHTGVDAQSGAVRENGRIMFPVLEPFGDALSAQLTDPLLRRKFVYDTLYSSTLTVAREFQEFNRFTIRGTYRSSVSSEISLGAFNIPPGSVRVTAGRVLTENVDYEVDYNIGRVRILNDAVLDAGTPINISFEDNALFGFQTKTMLGLRADYEMSENLRLGGTYLHLFERPYTQKVNIGDDPINNRIYGLDLTYSAEAPWLTKLVDKIPLIQTKAPSSITFSAEAAALKPGHAKAINENAEDGSKDKGGVVYLDDFEGSVSSIDLRTPVIGNGGWVLASVPQNDAQNSNPMFPESEESDTILSGVNRGLVNWYRLDPSIQDNSNPYTATIQQEEVFRNFTPTTQLNSFIPILDVRYCPDERGPYNFDFPGGTQYSSGLSQEGKLIEPGSRWGGIMRPMNTNDFEAANIEFIEFWMLSPYIDPTSPGNPSGNPEAADGSMNGSIYFELGNVSEDVMKDGRKFFENGLPGPNTSGRRITETGWGNVPLTQQITTAFDIDQENRLAQDVGLDGLNDAQEAEKFDFWLNELNGSVNANVVSEIAMDPSNDNFRHFRDFENSEPVFERYARWFGTEGNTPPQQGNNLTTASNPNPDTEDLDRDRTLNETESYFQYRIPVEHDGGIGIQTQGNPFITDTVQAAGNRVWYRFRVPLNLNDDNDNFKRVGGIRDFRSIRFMRVYFKDFEKKVNFRFASLELVRNQWRRYRQTLGDPCLTLDVEEEATDFDVNAVNIEENSTRAPFGYVLPPGISREQALGVNLNALQNEQSLSLGVCDLSNGDAKGIYKLVDMDMRVFKRMKMYVHAERKDCGFGREDIDDGDLSVFIRIGSDFKNNYYEYEIPLSFSNEENVPLPNSEEYPRAVWLEDNDFNINFESLKDLKIERNTSGAQIGKPYVIQDPENPKNKLKIVGNPSLGYVKSVMIGMLNPCGSDDEEDDGLAHSAEIWVNELRVFGLDESGGVAATAQLDLKLADFGAITLNGLASSIGFGALDQQLAQRSREEILEYDITTQLELGKFLGEKAGVRIPFYFQYSEEISNPQYDPYDLDIELKDKLRDASGADRDSIKRQAQTANKIKSISFTNVRKEASKKPGKKPMPWDISNFSATYGYDESESRDPIIESDKLQRHRGALDYTYSRKTKYIEPFKKGIKNDKYLGFVKNINFNPLPNSFSFSTELDRRFNTTKYRFSGDNPLFNTYYKKRFAWNRQYDLAWDIFKTLKVQFNAEAESLIDEPDENQLRYRNTLAPNDPLYIDNIKSYRRDSIFDNIKNFGRAKRYRHSLDIRYTLPLKNFPFLDWIDVKASYKGSYYWDAASLVAPSLGNVIRNEQTRGIDANLDFTKIYAYSKFLKKVDSKPRPKRGSRNTSRGKKPEPPKKGKDGKDDKKKKDGEPSKLTRSIIRPLLMLRKAQFKYQERLGTTIPGYRNDSELLGMSNFDSPGWDFVAGLQPNINQDDYYTSKDWLYNNYDWITDDPLLNLKVEQLYTQSIQGKVTIEPFSGFKVDLESKRDFTQDHLENFRRDFDDIGQNVTQEQYRHMNPRDFGRFTITYSAFQTLFGTNPDELFQTFKDNRIIIANRLGSGVHRDSVQAELGFPAGYGSTHGDVVIPAFIAAYQDLDASTMDIRNDYSKILFKTIPRINWKVNYSGLSKLPMFKDLFKKVSIRHGYSADLSVNSYQTDLQYDLDDTRKLNPNFDFYSRFEIPAIELRERFNPLFGFDLEFANELSFNFEINKSRNLGLRFATTDNNMTENKADDITFGFGYSLHDVNIGFLTGKKNKRKGRNAKKEEEEAKKNKNSGKNNRNPRGGGNTGESGDLDITFDFQLRDDLSVIRGLDDGLLEPARGSKTLTISPAVEYRISKQLSLRFFFDYRRNEPKTSQGFPQTNINSGITVRFSLN